MVKPTWKAIKRFFTIGYCPSLEELENEARMADLYHKILNTRDPKIKRNLWDKYTKLHNARSPGMVVHLERRKGLYRG